MLARKYKPNFSPANHGLSEKQFLLTKLFFSITNFLAKGIAQELFVLCLHFA